jgi:NitT/TauT family transport system permease protein
MKKVLKYSIITAIWLVIWQLAAMAVGEELLFPTPIAVANKLLELAATADFYKVILHSLLRILVGMIAGTLIGVLGGLATAFSKTAKAFFAPVLAVVKATPVASFIILLVLYISRDLTPLIISLMMVTPIVWAGVETGILNTDKSLLEMASAYKMSRADKIRHIFLPSIVPYFLAALKSSLGMAWKAGIAAEVLLEPVISIGRMIADAKSYIETADLFAWTVVVVVLSVIIERIMVFVLKKALKNYSFEKSGGVTLG